MLLLDCPWCGPREEPEFVCDGEVTLPTADPEAASDTDWVDALYRRTNMKGLHREWWCHRHGCRQWFWVERDTATHAVRGTGLPGSEVP